jgi:hypothetical protein
MLYLVLQFLETILKSAEVDVIGVPTADKFRGIGVIVVYRMVPQFGFTGPQDVAFKSPFRDTFFYDWHVHIKESGRCLRHYRCKEGVITSRFHKREKPKRLKDRLIDIIGGQCDLMPGFCGAVIYNF